MISFDYTEEQKQEYIRYSLDSIRQQTEFSVLEDFVKRNDGHVRKKRRMAYRKSGGFYLQVERRLQRDPDYQALSQGLLTPRESERMCLRLENGSPRKKRKRKSSRTRARDRERAKQAEDFLEESVGQTSLDVFFQEYYQKEKKLFRKEAKKRVREHFQKSDPILLPAGIKRFGGFQWKERKPESLEDLDGILNEIIEKKLAQRIAEYELLTGPCPCTPAMDVYPELKQIDRILGREVVEEKDGQAVCDLVFSLLSDLHFTKEQIRSWILSNPAYRYLVRNEEEARRTSATILTTIPDRYIDLYPAARSIHRKFTVHVGPTNSGKTHDAVKIFENCRNGVYLAPLRLLAYEQYDSLNRKGIICSLFTGEERETLPGSRVTASTIEMADLNHFYDVAVIDEAQMIADMDRGGAWTNAILGLPAEEIMVCCAPEAEEKILQLIESCGDQAEVVRHYRKVPLVVESSPFHYPEDVREGDALIVFSRKDVHSVGSELSQLGIQASIIYGSLPYDVRHRQAELFAQGQNKVIVSTDAIGMGMNLPIPRIVFLSDWKFNGRDHIPLPAGLIRQIAGRAGRYGIFPEGLVTARSEKFLQRIQRVLQTPPEQIHTAVLDFPSPLLCIDAPLSVLLQQWKDLTPKSGFQKPDIDMKVILAKELEKDSDDREKIFRFVTIPFSERDRLLRKIWREMFRDECAGIHFPVVQALANLERELEDKEEITLDRLEEDYRIADLLYHYTTRFLPLEEKEETEMQVIRVKNTLSRRITGLLRSRKLSRKRCRLCGKFLPWDYRYETCDECRQSN